MASDRKRTQFAQEPRSRACMTWGSLGESGDGLGRRKCNNRLCLWRFALRSFFQPKSRPGASGWLLWFVLALIPGIVGAAGEAERPHLRASPEAMRWWSEARLGVFICWGPVSLKGVEVGWGRGKARSDQKQGGHGSVPAEVYDSLYKEWNPTRFDAKEWVELVKTAGARYVIFLIKHHDGFCLFDTKLTDYRITSPLSPFRRDIGREIADACRAAGVKLFWYYSQPDWHHPDYRTADHARYIQYLHGQLRELCSNYGRIDGVWFDGLGGSAKDWDAEPLFQLIRELQPHAIINNRCGLAGDFDTRGRRGASRAWLRAPPASRPSRPPCPCRPRHRRA